MDIINWKDSYSVGIELFDNHHKMLIDWINILAAVVGSTEDIEFIDVILKKLVQYTQFHFKAEEEVMEKYQYSQKDSHIDEHNSFIKMIDKYYKNIDSEGYLFTAIDMLNYLTIWLEKHILISDKKYGVEFKELNI